MEKKDGEKTGGTKKGPKIQFSELETLLFKFSSSSAAGRHTTETMDLLLGAYASDDDTDNVDNGISTKDHEMKTVDDNMQAEEPVPMQVSSVAPTLNPPAKKKKRKPSLLPSASDAFGSVSDVSFMSTPASSLELNQSVGNAVNKRRSPGSVVNLSSSKIPRACVAAASNSVSASSNRKPAKLLVPPQLARNTINVSTEDVAKWNVAQVPGVDKSTRKQSSRNSNKSDQVQ